MRRGLTIVISGPDPDRLRSALGLAAAEAALGGRVRLFFDAGSVPALGTWPEMLDAAIDLGVRILVCQTGLAEQQVALDSRYEAGGLVSLMADIGEDRLIFA